MNLAQQLSEQELVDLTCLAIKSLDLQARMKNANSGDHLYFLTEDAFTEITALGGDTCTPYLGGRPFPPSDIDPFHGFVRQGMYDGKLWGFVPLTDKARRLLEIHRSPRYLSIITHGEEVRGRSFDLYN